MARRARDYRAEEARRNARAREAGFSSRAQERTARRRAQAWSDKHSQSPDSRYRPKLSARSVRAYVDTFLSKDKGWRAMKPRYAPPQAVKDWYMIGLRRYSSAEWDEKYGPPGGLDPATVQAEKLFGEGAA